jgi:hypothetical protein
MAIRIAALLVIYAIYLSARQSGDLAALDLPTLRDRAERGDPKAQNYLGLRYQGGDGVPLSPPEAVRWYRKAADQGFAPAQHNLARMYEFGKGVPLDYVQAHMWFNIAAAQGYALSIEAREILANSMTPEQVARAQELAASRGTQSQRQETSDSSGSGFIITSTGHVLTNYHVVSGCSRIAVRNGDKTENAVLLASDPENDLALLRIGATAFLVPLAQNSRLKLGQQVVVAGFPLQGLLATGLHVTTGTVSALAGPKDDSRYVQITAPVQPGNSGGPVFDLAGNVVGVITSKLDWLETAKRTGDLPENVGFALKSSAVVTFLDSIGIDLDSRRIVPATDMSALVMRAKRAVVSVRCSRAGNQ